jgi:hypothetical protein
LKRRFSAVAVSCRRQRLRMRENDAIDGGVMQDAEHVVIEAESEDEVLRLKTPDLEAVARNAIAIRHPAANLWQGDMGLDPPTTATSARLSSLSSSSISSERCTTHRSTSDRRPGAPSGKAHNRRPQKRVVIHLAGDTRKGAQGHSPLNMSLPEGCDPQPPVKATSKRVTRPADEGRTTSMAGAAAATTSLTSRRCFLPAAGGGSRRTAAMNPDGDLGRGPGRPASGGCCEAAGAFPLPEHGGD